MKQYLQKSNGIIWLILSLITFIADISSKFLITHYYFYGESTKLFSFFAISYNRNIGAAFSILEGKRILLIIVAIGISLFILYSLYQNRANKIVENSSLSLILGGALGNLFDRIYHGYVIDFFDITFGHWHYPTFNIADCAICLGIILYIFSNIIYKSRKK